MMRLVLFLGLEFLDEEDLASTTSNQNKKCGPCGPNESLLPFHHLEKVET